MEYKIETWSLDQLYGKYKEERLDLNPPYQRKFIWDLNDQRTLIGSIMNNYPIPNIFLFEKTNDNYEMVDGQQRSRTIFAFIEQQFSTFENQRFNIEAFPKFLDYKISVIIITQIDQDEIFIEDFYSLVNSAGVHLNRPELKKAEYFKTKFLKLISECNQYESFKALNLFTETVIKRMNDFDLVSELIAQLKEGVTDKKETVDKLYENDVNEEDYNDLLIRFKRTIDIINLLNILYPVKKTRYKQRNDFYTLFGFIDIHNQITIESLKYFYKLLVEFGEDIYPSNETSNVFQTYARNCVTQSNSKSARLERLAILESIFLNETASPNLAQQDILNYYQILDSELQSKDLYYTLNLNRIMSLKPNIQFNG